MSIEQGPSYEEEKAETVKNFDDLILETEKGLGISEDESVEKSVEKSNSEVEERTTQEQSEKEAVAMEQIEPLIKEFDHARKQENFFEGGRYYHALTSNEKSYSKWIEGNRERRAAEADIYNRMERQFAEIAGKEAARKRFITRYPTKEETKASRSKKISTEQMMIDDQRSLEGRLFAISVMRPGVEIEKPEQLVKELKENRDYMRSEVYRGHVPEEYEKRITDDVYGFHRVAQGFGLAALESSDIKIAAKSLAFAQSVEEMPQDVLDRFNEEFSKLDDKEKKGFITAIRSEQKELEEAK